MEHLLLAHGYLAVAFLAFVEACCVPIPSEVTFGFAGVLAREGHLSLAAVIALGSVAELAGSYVSYAAGRFGGRPLVERVGRYVLLSARDLDRAERFFDGRGEFALALGRALPVVRAFVSVVAGTVGMRALRFGLFSALGTVVYAGAFAGTGYALASEWHHLVREFSLAGTVLAVLVVASLLVGLGLRLRDHRAQPRA